MTHRNRHARSDPLFYVLPIAAGLGSAALADALDIGDVGKYVLAFALLTLTGGWLLARAVRADQREMHFIVGQGLSIEASRAEEERHISSWPSSSRTGFSISRHGLGLDVAEARSEEEEPARPKIWLPSATATRRISFCAAGSGLVVGAVAAEGGALIARVDLAAYRSVYVLLSEVDGRAGETFVPNLARDLVDQKVAVEWLSGMAELSPRDLPAIVASVAAAKHGTRAAWARAAEGLPADDPIREAIVDAAA